MYGHGLCTLMLAEALGMPRDDEMDENIRKALKARGASHRQRRPHQEIPRTRRRAGVTRPMPPIRT